MPKPTKRSFTYPPQPPTFRPTSHMWWRSRASTLRKFMDQTDDMDQMDSSP